MVKVKVYAKVQNRTALGIIHAYMKLNPNATLEDLRKVFPNSLNPDSGVKENFIYENENSENSNWSGYFRADDELIALSNGKRVSVVSMWTKPSLERIIAQAKSLEIAVEQVDTKVDGGFRLEYLNGFTPKSLGDRNAKPVKWIIGAIALIILTILTLILL